MDYPRDTTLNKETVMLATMTLTQEDVRNASHIRDRFQASSKAGAVSVALRVTKQLAEVTENPNFDCFLVHFPKTGEVQKLSISGLTH